MILPEINNKNERFCFLIKDVLMSNDGYFPSREEAIEGAYRYFDTCNLSEGTIMLYQRCSNKEDWKKIDEFYYQVPLDLSDSRVKLPVYSFDMDEKG